MYASTLSTRRRLYLLARVVVARHYRQPLTLAEVARALASSPRELQRAYAQFGETTFREDLQAKRMAVGAKLLVEQRAIPVADVARLVGYCDGGALRARVSPPLRPVAGALSRGGASGGGAA